MMWHGGMEDWLKPRHNYSVMSAGKSYYKLWIKYGYKDV